MHRPIREPDRFGANDADIQARPYLRRLREDPLDAIVRIAGEIGPRPATSLGEAQAAAYLDGRLRRAGLRVSADPFRASQLPGVDGLLLGSLAALGVGFYYWLPIPSLILALWGLLIAALGLRFPNAPLFARERFSQNVIATRAALEAPRWRVVLLAPLDSPPAIGRLGRLPGAGAWAPPGRAIACGALAICALLGLLDVRRLWWYLQAVPAVYLMLLALIDLRALWAPASPGAISHAGALAVLLASVEELTSLQHTELWAVPLGATASGAGLADLLRRYPFDSEQTLFVGIEGIGSGTLSYISSEGLARERAADAVLLRLVAAVDAADPLIDAEPRAYRYRDGATVVAPLQRSRRRVLTIMCLDAEGWVPYRGSLDDGPEVVDPQVVERAVRLVTGLVRAIDRTTDDAR